MTILVFSEVVQKQLKFKYNPIQGLILFSYPAVIFLQDLLVKVVKLNEPQADQDTGEFEINLQHNVIDNVIKGNLLWLILETGNILVINLETGGTIKLIQNEYKFQHFSIYNEDILITTLGGEYVSLKVNINDVVDKIHIGICETEVSVQRHLLEKPLNRHKKLENLSWKNGCYFSIENNEVTLECPYTGLKERMETPLNTFKYITTWDELLVLSNDTEIKFYDISTADIPFQCKAIQSQFYPLKSHENMFFYIQNINDNMSIKCILRRPKEYVDDVLEESTTKLKICQAQDTLKNLAACMKEEIIQSENGDDLGGKISKLIDLFLQIEDKVFILDTVVNLAQHNVISKDLVNYLESFVGIICDPSLVLKVCNFIVKVDVINYIRFKKNHVYDQRKIFEMDFTELCIQFLSNSDFDLVTISWLKFSDFQVSFMTGNDLSNILDSVPVNTKLSVLVIWLKCILVPFLRANPFFVDVFVRWITERIFMLEKSANWPKIGLKFVSELMSVLVKSMPNLNVKPLSMDDLIILKYRISQIMELKDKYKINIMLAEFSSQNPTEVALIMLHRCYTEDLSSFLKEYLPRFSIRHSFELDDILRTYMESEATSGGGNIEAQRLTTLLDAFKIQNVKLNSLLTVLRALEVPWDKVIYDIAIKVSVAGDTDFTFTESDKTVAQSICEEIKFANVKVVLKKYNFPLGFSNYILVINKIIESPSVDIQSLKVITDFKVSCKTYGYVSYIDRCLRDCNTADAKRFFKTLNRNESKYVLKALISKYEFLIDNDLTSPSTERSYIDFFKTTHLESLHVEAIESMYHLKYSYQIKTTMNTIHCEECINSSSSKLDIDTVSILNKVMIGIGHTECSKIINLLHQTSSTCVVRNFIENVIQFIYALPLEKERNTAIFSLFSDNKNDFILMESCKILSQLLNVSSEEHIYSLTKVISIFNAMALSSTTLMNLRMTWKFNYLFLPISSTNAFNNLLNFYMNFITTRKNTFEETFNGNAFNNNELVQLRVFVVLLENQGVKLPICNYFIELRQTIFYKLIPKIIATEEIDELLLTSLLLIIDKSECGEYTNDSLFELWGSSDKLPTKLTSYLSKPGIRRLFNFSQMLTRNTLTYTPQHILSSKHNLNVLDIALPDITDETWDAKLVLFIILKQHPDLDLENIKELCNTLNVPLDDGLSLQLIAVLSTWDLKFNLIDDGLSKKKISCDDNENILLNRCTVIWESIQDKTFITGILYDFLKNGEVSLHGKLISINSYHYEVYLCILSFIYDPSEDIKQMKEYFLLHFLKEYTRHSSPKQYEFEQFSIKGMFPEIGNYRLPFHLFTREDMWSNLKSEITLETYERWLPVVSLLSLDSNLQTARDMICSNALKQTMTSAQKTSGSLESISEERGETWTLSSRGEPLLRAAHRCVKNIANMEWAGACLFYVLQGCARGADQVAAAQLCFQFAQQWDALQPGNRAVRQMQRLHSTLSTQHALHKIDWATEDLVRLSVEPVQLIRNMYLHTDFPDKMSKQDINKSANEIADKNGINISTIRIQIIENILDHDANLNSIGLDNKTLLTAKYILRATSPKMAAIYLSRIAFDEESNYNKIKKLRALQCLMSITDPDAALKVTKRDRNMLWELLQEMYYVINLELNEQPWAVEVFINNKFSAIKQLCEAVETNSNIHIVKLIGDLTLKYGDKAKLDNILTLLQRAALYEDMIPLLLNSLSASDKVIKNAWRAVLVMAFKTADYPLTEKQKITCLRIINLLPACPIICDEDLKEIWDNCVRCKCYGIGCLVLPYMSNELRSTLKELRRIDRRNLIISVKNLNTETYLVSGVLDTLECILPKLHAR